MSAATDENRLTYFNVASGSNLVSFCTHCVNALDRPPAHEYQPGIAKRRCHTNLARGVSGIGGSFLVILAAHRLKIFSWYSTGEMNCRFSGRVSTYAMASSRIAVLS